MFGIDTHVENASHKRPLLLIETDTTSSLNIGIFNVQVSCAYILCQIRESKCRRNVSNIPEDMLRV